MVYKCEVLEDKINLHMQNLETALAACTGSAERRELEEERNNYLLDVSYLLSSEDEDMQEEAASYPDFVSLTERGPSRAKLLHRYRTTVEKSLSPEISDTRSEDDFVCPCGSSDVIVDERLALLVCQDCALCRAYWSCSGNLSFNEEKHMIPEGNFAYQRIKSPERAARSDSGQTTDRYTRKDILNQVRLELKKQRILDIEKVTMNKVNKILRSLKLIKYYEHSNYICYLITGKTAFANGSCS